MLIAIVGSSLEADKTITKQIQNNSTTPVIVWQLLAKQKHTKSNVRAKLDILKHLSKPHKNELLVIQSINFAEEANYIRENNGFVWHVEGGISNHIPIKANDIQVTDKFNQKGVYLAVQEALHHCELKGSPTNALPTAHVPWRR